MICPASVVKSMTDERLIAWDLDMTKMTEHLAWIRTHPEFTSKIYNVFSDAAGFPVETDPDLMIYNGFLSGIDKSLAAEVRSATEIELAEKEFHFVDQRLPELFFRYKARNFPDSLNEEESDKWEKYRASKLLDNNSQYLTFNLYFERIQEIASSEGVTARDLNILEDLKYYAESILPYN
tara:strand:- start:140 stop:679 length:540 start_codon:yes stop_codon:yes gene_type:complete